MKQSLTDKERIIKDIKQAVYELKLVKSGKLKAKPVEELIKRIEIIGKGVRRLNG
jgi:methanogenic corrinoid protein MtbC1